MLKFVNYLTLSSDGLGILFGAFRDKNVVFLM